MAINKHTRFPFQLASLLLILVLLSAPFSSAQAQQPTPGSTTSQQPEPAQPAAADTPTAPAAPGADSPWGAQPASLVPGNNTDPTKFYLAATWDDASIHFLDSNMNNTGSFPVSDPHPNGVATDGSTIYVVSPITLQVRAYNYYGNILFSWTDPRLAGAQGLELVDGQLAVFAGGINRIHFFEPVAGVYLRSIPGQYAASEGLAYDGVLLWNLAETLIGINPADGTLVRSLPNPAIANCPYVGTGLTASAYNQLTVACTDGKWYQVSTVDGSVVASGNNGLNMFGLASSNRIQMNPVYLRSSVGQPWGLNDNENAMNQVFGAGYWQDLRYETADTGSLFSLNTNLVFMEGGDKNADELESFLAANQAALEHWVARGGCLLVNAAPNEGDGMSLGFDGVSLLYNANLDYLSTEGIAVDPAHPIFNAPFLPAGSTYTGAGFSHASISGGGVTDIITGTQEIDPKKILVSLAEKSWGLGHVMYGGMTMPYFQHPQPNSFNLRANLLYYLSTFGCKINYPPTARDDGTLFYEDFESGYDRWTMDGLWNPESQSDACGSLHIPFPSPFNAAYYGQDGTCNYDTGAANSGSLTLNTPVSLPPGSLPLLVFASFEQTENICTYVDRRIVEISNDGGATWTPLGEQCNENAWNLVAYNLSAYTGQSVQVRFRFDSIDNILNDYFGWMVDNISIQMNSSPFKTDEDTPFVTPSVLWNDTDPNGDPVSLLSVDTTGLLGTLTDRGNGIFLYDPREGFNYLAAGEQAVDSFTYVASDGVFTDTGNVHILVAGLNDAPIAVADTYATPEDTLLSPPEPGVMANDTDPEGDPMTAKLVTPPAVGSLTLAADGEFGYTPELDFNGLVTFTYTSTDGLASSTDELVKVHFNEPEFIPGSPVDEASITSLYGRSIPPLGFGFTIAGAPSPDAHFSASGPGYTAYITPPNIEGSSLGTLAIDFGADVNSAGFGFALSCPPIADAITATAYTVDLSPLGTITMDSINSGYVFGENRVEIKPGGLFRSLQIDFSDKCARFVVDDLAYTLYTGPTLVSIHVTPVNDPPILDPMPNQTVNVGDVFNLVETFTDVDLLDTHTVRVEWQKGVTSSLDLEAGVKEFTLTHVYPVAGSYLVIVDVFDNQGGSDSRAFTITVNKARQLLPIVVK